MRIYSVVKYNINNIDKLNQQSFTQYNTNTSVKWEYYIRAFLPDIWAVHQKIFFKTS